MVQLSSKRKANPLFPLIPGCISASYYTETEKADRWAPRGQQIKLNLSQDYTWPSGRDAEIQTAVKRKAQKVKKWRFDRNTKGQSFCIWSVITKVSWLQKLTLRWIISFLKKQRLECFAIKIFEHIFCMILVKALNKHAYTGAFQKGFYPVPCGGQRQNRLACFSLVMRVLEY